MQPLEWSALWTFLVSIFIFIVIVSKVINFIDHCNFSPLTETLICFFSAAVYLIILILLVQYAPWLQVHEAIKHS